MYGELPEIETTSGEKIQGYPVRIENSAVGPKTAVLRLPTSSELLVYLSAQRSIYRDLGRRMGEGEDVPNPKADLDLFRAIRLDKGPASVEFDEAEALCAIDRITRHQIVYCDRNGQTYVVKLLTPFGGTEHTVSIPWQKDMAEYRRQVYKARDMPHGVEERRFPPEVPVKLYDKIVQDVTGYAESLLSVPPHHKRSVVSEVINALALLDPGLDPNS